VSIVSSRVFFSRQLSAAFTSISRAMKFIRNIFFIIQMKFQGLKRHYIVNGRQDLDGDSPAFGKTYSPGVFVSGEGIRRKQQVTRRRHPATIPACSQTSDTSLTPHKALPFL
jgi:hypothetical protein